MQEKFEDLTNQQVKRGINTLKELKELLNEDERSQQSLREVLAVGQRLIAFKNQMMQQPQVAAQAPA